MPPFSNRETTTIFNFFNHFFDLRKN
jgi:hypothetical protein